MARPLAEIKTPEAIQALVEDLAVIGSQSQTGWALVKIGPTALPHLLPILADDKHAHAAAGVIHWMGEEALVVAPNWVSLAASTDNPKNMRLAALRGLAAMREGARQHGKDLRAQLASPDADIRADAFKTLLALRDPSAVMTVAENCHPSGTALYRMPHQSYCLLNIAAFREDARTAGSHLMKFLVSPNGEEVALAVIALGNIGYDTATPEIEQRLRSPDWRVVYAAASSLGWLGATGSVPELERVASGHWLPEVRERAVKAADALKGGERRMSKPFERKGDALKGRLSGMVSFEYDGTIGLFFGGSFARSILESVPACRSGRWAWRDLQFSAPPPSTYSTRLPLDAGELIGSNRGEFGGDLAWKPASGQTQLIHKHNVVGIEPAESGAIVLFGLAHMGFHDGYAVRVSQRADGGWSLTEVARLPSTADALARIGPNLFAAWSDNRVVVLSDNEILGLARCVGQ
jgi:HEAT repeat protein